MNDDKIYLITDIDGFTPQIGRLISMMNYARRTTLNTVKGLTTAQLDYLHDETSNTIGALLLHMAAVEFGYQLETFHRRKPTDEESAKWNAAFKLGQEGRDQIKGKPLDYYMQELGDMRQATLDQFRQRTDRWLVEEEPFWGGKPANNYFKWFHVFEDEINHRGQIRWLRKRALGQA
ncbi:MAG: integrase [Paenibacillaceae bacterium]|nr:integrase [Paenibacillaceae bacterium]